MNLFYFNYVDHLKRVYKTYDMTHPVIFKRTRTKGEHYFIAPNYVANYTFQVGLDCELNLRRQYCNVAQIIHS